MTTTRRWRRRRERKHLLRVEELERRWVLSAPNVVSVSPPSNSHSAPADTDLAITFDQTVNAESVSSETLVVHGTQAGRPRDAVGAVTVNGETLSLQSAQPFFPGELVQATATTRIENQDGQGLSSPFNWQFRTGVGEGNGKGSALFRDGGTTLDGEGALGDGMGTVIWMSSAVRCSSMMVGEILAIQGRL